MPVTVNVKSKDDVIRMRREKAAQRVVSHFGLCVPQSRVLCFLDDENPSGLKRVFGMANRGFYGVVRDGDDLSQGIWPWPDYLSKSKPSHLLAKMSKAKPRGLTDLLRLFLPGTRR